MLNLKAEQLAQTITKKSSIQTYYTIKLLFDKPLVNDGYKAYAYFRWIDDQVDVFIKGDQVRHEFIQRQRNIIEATYNQIAISDLTPEEEMIVELIKTEPSRDSRLASYILNLFNIIEFDVYRKGKLITEKELDWYSESLGKSVTDCIAHFIDHDKTYPNTANKYDAATASHVIHMLRDYQEDLADGFMNIPKEYLDENKIQPTDIKNQVLKEWVKMRIEEAKQKFISGREYINQIPSLRSKIAATLYCVRFEWLMTEYEKNNYNLDTKLSHRNNLVSYLRMIYYFATTTFRHLLFNNK